MTYFKSLFFNFLTVFFVNHVIPGIDIAYYSKLPDIGGDIIFAFILGFLNSMIVPLCLLLHIRISLFRIGLASFLITFLGYALVNMMPGDIRVATFGAYIWASLVVWFASYFTNYLEYKRHLPPPEE
ncbi:MAG: phage holin family protein [Parachlamydiales bacterium]|nr:phage holin family protein [Parachlamydiales bacterium]